MALFHPGLCCKGRCREGALFFHDLVQPLQGYKVGTASQWAVGAEAARGKLSRGVGLAALGVEVLTLALEFQNLLSAHSLTLGSGPLDIR